jgi:uncharacterized protein (TIGR02246 family)
MFLLQSGCETIMPFHFGMSTLSEDRRLKTEDRDETSMDDDERAIRELILSWMTATMAGDVAHLKILMAEDVVFLTAGQAPMRGREAFVASFAAALEKFQIRPSSDIQEIKIFGDHAYCWNDLRVTMTSKNDGSAIQRAGPALTILQKKANGRWVIARDANMLAMA